MKKSVKNRTKLWQIALVLLSVGFNTAYADTRCSTTSGGQEFTAWDASADTASTSAVSQCQGVDSSNADECSLNLSCDDGTNPMMMCQTQSAGNAFQRQSAFESIAKIETTFDCTRSQGSDAQECSSNMACQLAPAAPVDPAPADQPAPSDQPAPAPVDPVPADQPAPSDQPAPAPVQDEPAPAPAPSLPTAKITSINGDYNPNHSNEMYVHPGDMITFSADLLDAYRNYSAMGDSVEDFVWNATDNMNSTCDANLGKNCLENSSFQTTDYGVTYYVPYNMGQSVVLSVISHNPAAIDTDGNASQDLIVLRNASYSEAATYTPPTVVATSPDTYQADTFNATYALAGHGHWVWIGGVRYFVPNTYVVGEGSWAPYQHGYWSWDNEQGFTWISYDPWGWVTDHYGVWRYHGIYGWIWLPFDDFHYVPHAVTWFHDGEHVGWYPYHAGYSNGYHHGYEHGFRDGYWDGYRAGQNASYHPGYVVVHRDHVTQVNVYQHIVHNNTVIINRVVVNNNFSAHPGGDRDKSRRFIEAHGQPLPVTRTVNMNSHGAARIMAPTPVHAVPAVYTKVAQNTSLTRRTAMGSVVSAKPGEEIRTIHATTNGKGIVAPPTAKDASGKVIVLPPRTTKPAQAEPSNHISVAAAKAKPVATAGSHTTAPVFNPTAAKPAPIAPKTSPTAKPPVMTAKPLPPAPKPKPVPPAKNPVQTTNPTKPPVRTNPTTQPTRTNPTTQPTRTNPTTQPTRTTPTTTPTSKPPVHTEPTKKPEPTKAPVKETAKTEPAKTEPAKTAPAKTEPAKTAPAKTEPAKAEPAKPAPAKAEPAKVDNSKAEAEKKAAEKKAADEKAAADKKAAEKKAADEKAAADKAAADKKAADEKAEAAKKPATTPAKPAPAKPAPHHKDAE